MCFTKVIGSDVYKPFCAIDGLSGVLGPIESSKIRRLEPVNNNVIYFQIKIYESTSFTRHFALSPL